jgi:hypothetical protein
MINHLIEKLSAGQVHGVICFGMILVAAVIGGFMVLVWNVYDSWSRWRNR